MQSHQSCPPMPDAEVRWILMSGQMRMSWWAPAGAADPLADHVGLHADRQSAEKEIAEILDEQAGDGRDPDEVDDDDLHAMACRIDDAGNIILLDGDGGPEALEVGRIARVDWYEAFGMAMPPPNMDGTNADEAGSGPAP